MTSTIYCLEGLVAACLLCRSSIYLIPIDNYYWLVASVDNDTQQGEIVRRRVGVWDDELVLKMHKSRNSTPYS